ncbi:MAG: cysteine desulfurase [Thermodesulfobacteria bacterium]|nr:cysteine desulfurase [Thermodesulfobacteriota bacterium]
MVIYLDHNATTPTLPEVAEVVNFFLTEEYGNPSCGHTLGQRARKALEAAREEVASLIEARREEIIFLSGGTEANNLALFGTVLAHPKAHLITSRIEHPSVLNPCVRLLELGYDVTFLPVDGRGLVDPAQVKKALKPHTRLVSIMWANNETGVIQPVKEIGEICQEAGVLFHTDAAQAVGKIRVSVEEVPCDLLTIAGHKLYAPKGVGALYVRRGVRLQNLLYGAGQERGLRPGTEPVALACGLGKACSLAARDLKAEAKREEALREKLYGGLKEIFPALLRHGPPEKTLPNTLSVSFPGYSGEEILRALPEICASTGAACHDRGTTISHVLYAMGVPPEIARGTIRLSLGRLTTVKDLERALSLFRRFFSR